MLVAPSVSLKNEPSNNLLAQRKNKIAATHNAKREKLKTKLQNKYSRCSRALPKADEIDALTVSPLPHHRPTTCVKTLPQTSTKLTCPTSAATTCTVKREGAEITWAPSLVREDGLILVVVMAGRLPAPLPLPFEQRTATKPTYLLCFL